MSERHIALLGFGKWGRNLARNLHQLGVLAALADADALARERAAHLYKDVRVHADSGEILRDPSIKAVVIATPAATHGQLARQALLAGKDVMVEKPLCLSVEEARDLVHLADHEQRILMVGHLLHYHPAIERLKALVHSGALGHVHYISSSRLNLGRVRTEENVLWSFAPHDISVILALMGSMPVGIQAHAGRFLRPETADTTVSLLDFPGGARAHLHVSWLHPYKEQRLVVVGDKQMAVFDDLSADCKLALYPYRVPSGETTPVFDGADATQVPLDPVEPLFQECLHFLECVNDRRTPVTDGKEGLRVLQVLQQCHEASHQTPSRGTYSIMSSAAEVHPSAVIDDNVDIGPGTRVWHFTHLLPGTRIGSDCSLGQNVVIGPNVTVGSRCKIQNNVSVYEGVTLEDDVFCGPSVVFTNVINPRAEFPRMAQLRRTLVKHGASLGANSTIVCGVTIGRYAFVAAGAVVTRDVPDHVKVIGSPARTRGYVCRCAEPIVFDHGLAKCAACGTCYGLSDGRVLPADNGAAATDS